MDTLNIDVKRESVGDIEVVSASGEVTVLNISEFRKTITDVVDSERGMVVDLREVSYIDSAGLEQLIVALTRQQEQNESFAILVSNDSQPHEVLHIVQLDTLTKVTSNPEEVGLGGRV